MTILFGLVFSVINPLLPPMCIIYFFIANLTEKYNMLYVERPSYQSGGQVYLAECCADMHHCLIVSITIMAHAVGTEQA